MSGIRRQLLIVNVVCWNVLLFMFIYTRMSEPSVLEGSEAKQALAMGVGRPSVSAVARAETHRDGDHGHAEDADAAEHIHTDSEANTVHHHHQHELNNDIFQVGGHSDGVVSEEDQLAAPGRYVSSTGERPTFTREWFATRAEKNQLLVTFSNYQHRLFIVSFVRNLARLHINNYVIIALDDKLMEFLTERGVFAVRVDADEQVEADGLGWGSPAFVQLMRVKYVTTARIIKWGFDLLVTDADIGYMRNPFPYLYYHGRRADILITSDNLDTSTYDGGLELPTPGKPEFNCGFVYIRPTERSIAFFDALVETLVKDESLRDQPAINILLAKGYEGTRVIPGTRIFHAWNGNLRMGALPTLLFCNGHVYFTQKLPQRIGITPYIAHATHVYSGDCGKRTRLRETRLFYDDISYYADGKFLSFGMEIAPELVTDGSGVPRESIPEKHIAMASVQIGQVMDAAILAKRLGRILIMPPMLCSCDRYWYFMTACRMNNNRGFQLPNTCPLDHFFNLCTLQEKLGVDFREYTFLTDDRVPQEVKRSRVSFYFCDPEKDGDCDSVQRPDDPDEVWLQEGGTDEWWDEFLKPYADKRIIHIDPMRRAFSGMADQNAWQKWKGEARGAMGSWCCHKDGPVHMIPDWYK